MPRTHRLWGHANLLHPIETMHERLGDLAEAYPVAATLRIGPWWLPLWFSRPLVVINNPRAARDAFDPRHTAALGHEPEILENVTTVMGGGLLGTDGPLWEARRAYVTRRFFSREALCAAAPIIERHVERALTTLAARSDPAAAVDLCKDHLVPLLLGVIVQLMCGEDDASCLLAGGDDGDDGRKERTQDDKRCDLSASLVRDMNVVFAEFNDRTFRLFKTLRRTSDAHQAALPRIQAHIDRLIARRRSSGRDIASNDLLSILVSADNDNDQGSDNDDDDDTASGYGDAIRPPNPYQSNADIRAEALLFMFAGFESTSSTLSYAIHLLAHHPHIQEHLRLEVALWRRSGREPASVLSGALPLMEGVIRETMRIYPIAHVLTRHVKEPLAIGPYVVPAGARLLVNNLAISNSSAVWPDAHLFSPQRWMGPAGGGDRYASMPFGIGRRACPGQRLAMLKMKLTLAALVERFQFMPDPARPHLECRVTLAMQPYRYSICCVPLGASDSGHHTNDGDETTTA
jgi:cytochrome P450